MTDDPRTPDPMELWQRVCVTDPAHTKHINQRGGFTAIDAQYQIKTATAEWGPMGELWGVKDCRYGYDGGEVWLEATFYYPNGAIEMSTDIVHKPGNESRKKLRTDLLTKSLSQLGFNSDVFEGRFDSNRHLDPAPQRPSTPRPQPQRSTPRPAPKNASPSQQGGKAGKGGPNQDCPKCGYDGITPRNFDASTNRPDLECPGDGQGGPPCIGREKNTGGHWPMGWYSWDRGTEPTNAAASRAAVDAQRPEDGPPVDAYEDEAPF